MFLDFILGNPVTRKVERQKKVDAEIELLKKQQKVRFESVTNDFDRQKAELKDATNAEINNLKARIVSLTKNKDAKFKVIDEEKKVALDKVNNEYDRKIITKKNLSKKLGYLIEAEQKNMQDVIEPETPNAPTATTKKVLLETSNKSSK